MAEQQDISAAEESYSGFLKLLKWGSVLAVAVAFIVVLIIAS